MPEIIGKERYKELAARNLQRPTPEGLLNVVWARLLKGEDTLLSLARENDMNYDTLRHRLPRIFGKKEYEEIMQRVKTATRRITPTHFGSPEARKQGSDSLFELRIKTLLESLGVEFKYRTTLKLGKHRYIPDFILPNHVILEVAGMSQKEYWKYYGKKTKHYIEAGYRVFVVVLDVLYTRAMKYLPRAVTIFRLSDFENNTAQVVRQMTTAA